MKRIIVTIAMLVVAATIAASQSRQLFGQYKLITTTRDSLFLNGAYVHLRVTNESTADSMLVWTSIDSTNQVKIYKGEIWNLDGLQARWIKRKSFNGNVGSRVVAW